MANGESITTEEKIAKLDELVQKIESSDETLDSSLKDLEEGFNLIKDLECEFSRIEKRIEEISSEMEKSITPSDSFEQDETVGPTKKDRDSPHDIEGDLFQENNLSGDFA